MGKLRRPSSFPAALFADVTVAPYGPVQSAIGLVASPLIVGVGQIPRVFGPGRNRLRHGGAEPSPGFRFKDVNYGQ
jgi:hypothetical protein